MGRRREGSRRSRGSRLPWWWPSARARWRRARRSRTCAWLALSLFAGFLGRGRGPGHLAGGQTAAMVLDHFLVAPELLLKLVQHLIGGPEHVLSGGAGHKVLGVFGLDVEL